MDEDESAAKRIRLSVKDVDSLSLSQRIRDIMQCSICMETPSPEHFYQCSRGHILCEGCDMQLLTESLFRNGQRSKCPLCRTQMDLHVESLNVVLKETLWLLPEKCPYCPKFIILRYMEKHKEVCDERPTVCKYECLGCHWIGSYSKHTDHERNCKYPNMSAEDILQNVNERNYLYHEDTMYIRLLYKQLNSMCSYFGEIEFNLRKVHNTRQIVYDSSDILAMGNLWMFHIYLVRNETPVHKTIDQSIFYALRLLRSPLKHINVNFTITYLPDLNVTLMPAIYNFRFEQNYLKSSLYILCFKNVNDGCRLLTKMKFTGRISMFFN